MLNFTMHAEGNKLILFNYIFTATAILYHRLLTITVGLLRFFYRRNFPIYRGNTAVPRTAVTWYCGITPVLLHSLIQGYLFRCQWRLKRH